VRLRPLIAMSRGSSKWSWMRRRTPPSLVSRKAPGWHAALFPTGYSGMSPIRVGRFRDDAEGPMQVVSGPVHRRRVHFEAPPAANLAMEVDRYLDWLDSNDADPPLIKAGLGHLWFVTLHPFDDGNAGSPGRLATSCWPVQTGAPQRFYSLSAQIQKDRKAYYEILERTQKGTLDVTAWLVSVSDTLHRAVEKRRIERWTACWRSRSSATMAGTALKRASGQGAQQDARRLRGQAHQQQVAIDDQGVLPDTALRDINELVSLAS